MNDEHIPRDFEARCYDAECTVHHQENIIEDLRKDVETWRNAANFHAKQAAWYRKALVEFGEHGPDCFARRLGKCNCGFEEALSGRPE